MEQLQDAALGLLSRDWAGLVLAALVLAVAIILYWWRKNRWLALVPAVIAVAMAIGSVVHIVDANRLYARYPAPGKFVEVQGMRLHVLAAGDSAGGPTFVLFGGGHAPGASMMHLQRALVANHRVVLIDRPGTGWSGPAKFPLSTPLEATMMWEALAASGEKGPFLLAGHSFGGLLVANMARRAPEKVHSLVLLDPTPPDAIVYGPRLGDLATFRREPVWRGLFALFGVDYDAVYPKPPQPPEYKRVEEAYRKQLGVSNTILEEFGKLPRSLMASASIYNELDPVGMAEAGWDIMMFDGELGDMPLYLVAPKTQIGIESLAEVKNGSQREAARIAGFFAAVRERAMLSSRRSTRVVAPPETGHNFVYEDPAFVIKALNEIAAR